MKGDEKNIKCFSFITLYLYSLLIALLSNSKGILFMLLASSWADVFFLRLPPVIGDLRIYTAREALRMLFTYTEMKVVHECG